MVADGLLPVGSICGEDSVAIAPCGMYFISTCLGDNNLSTISLDEQVRISGYLYFLAFLLFP